MFAEVREKATEIGMRIVRTTCLLLGGAFLLMGLLVILTPLLLGIALLLLASKAATTRATSPQPKYITVG